MAPNKGKAPKKGAKKIEKKLKTPTLAEKNALRNKIILADAFQWKPVDIPDTIGDYSGFFGLEELEGVDVRMVNGKPEFIAEESDSDAEVFIPGLTDKKKKGKQKKKTDAKDEKDNKATKKVGKLVLTDAIANQKFLSTSLPQEEDIEMEDDGDEEFTGFGDDSDEDNEDNKTKEDTKEKKSKDEKPQKPDTKETAKDDGIDDSELTATVFSSLNMPLPDDNEINLPEWNSLNLSPYLLNGLQNLGFETPTPIQKQTIPVSSEGRDLVGKATTGSGKTLAYGLPILEKYISKLDVIKETFGKTAQPPAGIIFAPTRELAHQVADHLNAIAKYSPLSPYGIVSITGGLSIHKQERLLSYGPGIIVATPGRFLELIEKNEELAKRLAATDIVVLDEADRLLQDGHFEEFERILNLMEKSRDKKEYGWKWQTLVFSATFSRDLFGKLNKNYSKGGKKPDAGLVSNDEIIELLAKKLKFKNSKPALVDANPKEIVSGQVTEALVECGALERDLYLYYFVHMYPGSTLVFANSVESVRRLVPFLENLQVPAFAIHSAMIQKQRLRSLERFKAACQSSKSAVLIATDVAARGLDIPNIDHVAHYHLPRSADVYIHRSGRTARAGKEGVSVMFCSPQEASGPLKKLRKLVALSAENTKFSTRADVKLLPIDHDLVSQIRDRVQIAAKLADASISGTATRKENSWLKQAAEDLGIENLSDVDDFEDDVIKKQRQRKLKNALTSEEQKALRYQLKEQLAVPLRKNHRRSYITSGLENLAHQIVSGQTSENVLGRKTIKALDELKGTKNRVEKQSQKQNQKQNSKNGKGKNGKLEKNGKNGKGKFGKK